MGLGGRDSSSLFKAMSKRLEILHLMLDGVSLPGAQTQWRGAGGPSWTPACNFITGMPRSFPAEAITPMPARPSQSVGQTPPARPPSLPGLRAAPLTFVGGGVIFLEIECVPLEICLPAACLDPRTGPKFPLTKTPWDTLGRSKCVPQAKV